MELLQRIDLMVRLGDYMLSEDPDWHSAKEKASYENGWFIPAFIELSVKNIARQLLNKEQLIEWTRKNGVPDENPDPLIAGMVMAGNIPLVGFHDFLCAFISGHHQHIKISSKDAILLPYLADKLAEWDPAIVEMISFMPMLKNCDAYIATGSNNSSRYFDYYFSKYPHIIRRNRTSVAILTGKETVDELDALAEDVYQYFGLGCRNVTKLYVPAGYDFIPLLNAFRRFNYLADHHKYKNNYDYQLAILIVNKLYYMTNGSVILVEDPALVSPISRLHYEYYQEKSTILEKLQVHPGIQCIVGKEFVQFGKAQQPGLHDFADGINTLKFFLDLCKAGSPSCKNG